MNQKELDIIQPSILIRCHQLLDQCPRSKRAFYAFFVERMKQRLQILIDLNNPIQPLIRAFFGDLMMACTRCYEGFDYIRKPNKIRYFHHNPHRDIIQADLKLSFGFHNHPQINEFNDQDIIEEAKQKLKSNKFSLSLICKKKVTNQMIDRYFNRQEFYTFSHESLGLEGLSTYHGQTTFIYIKVKDLLGTIIHEFGHNFPRFLMEKKKPRHISPKKNNRLRIWDEKNKQLQQIEAGDFLEYRIFGTNNFEMNPFGLKYRN